MILKIFTVYDQKAKAYLTPFFLPQDGMATRTFAECCNNPEHNFGKWPSDFTLFEIGEYNETTAELTPHGTPKSFGTGVEFLETNPD